MVALAPVCQAAVVGALAGPTRTAGRRQPTSAAAQQRAGPRLPSRVATPGEPQPPSPLPSRRVTALLQWHPITVPVAMASAHEG